MWCMCTNRVHWIFAVEMLVVGYKGGIRNCSLTFTDMNPVFRHNFVFAHQVHGKLRHPGEDEEVNTTQKNPNVASFMGRITCRPGSFALVIGAVWQRGRGPRPHWGECRCCGTGCEAIPRAHWAAGQ